MISAIILIIMGIIFAGFALFGSRWVTDLINQVWGKPDPCQRCGSDHMVIERRGYVMRVCQDCGYVEIERRVR